MSELVVLPGLDATGTLHEEFAAHAGTSFAAVRVLAYPSEQPLDYAALEVRVRAALPEHTPFVLLGESFSGPIALAIAAAPPPMLRGLVLSTTFARSPLPALAPFARVLAAAPLPVPPMRALSPLLLGRWATPLLESRLAAALASVPAVVLRSRVALALRADATRQLPKIGVPVLYLRASHHRLLSRNCGEGILAGLRDAECRDIAGPHLLLQAAPEACAQAVAGFAAR